MTVSLIRDLGVCMPVGQPCARRVRGVVHNRQRCFCNDVDTVRTRAAPGPNTKPTVFEHAPGVVGTRIGPDQSRSDSQEAWS